MDINTCLCVCMSACLSVCMNGNTYVRMYMCVYECRLIVCHQKIIIRGRYVMGSRRNVPLPSPAKVQDRHAHHHPCSTARRAGVMNPFYPQDRFKTGRPHRSGAWIAFGQHRV